MPDHEDERFYTVKSYATYLNVSEKTVRRRIKEGRLKVHRFGRNVRISKANRARFESEHEE